MSLSLIKHFSNYCQFGAKNFLKWVDTSYKLPICQIHHKHNSEGVIFEIRDGVGGSEAMLFAEEMLDVYCKYFSVKRWPYSQLEYDRANGGGVRLAKLKISAPNSFQTLIQEAGVHRVQRVPKTEKSGRVHTSTITIAITPETVLNVKINEKDLEWQTMRASAPGGQRVNKSESAVRLWHKPTGITVDSQEERFQLDNKRNALQKLTKKLQSIEMDRLTNQVLSLRKHQVGHADRNEKIRTYNFQQDRITDHRLGKSYYNLRSLMSGDVSILEKIIDEFH